MAPLWRLRILLKRPIACSVFNCLVACAIMFAAGKHASAQVVDGNMLLSSCTNENLEMFCTAYIGGSSDGLALGSFLTLRSLDENKSTEEINQITEQMLGVCVPPTATNLQIRDVSVKYVLEHPESRHETARLLIYLALVEAFPCQATD